MARFYEAPPVFNVGVEIGRLMFIAAVPALIASATERRNGAQACTPWRCAAGPGRCGVLAYFFAGSTDKARASI